MLFGTKVVLESVPKLVLSFSVVILKKTYLSEGTIYERRNIMQNVYELFRFDVKLKNVYQSQHFELCFLP